MSYRDKAFELVEEKDSQTSSDSPPTKQYRRSLIFKKVSFDRLKILKHCICVRVRFLLDVTCNIEYIMNSLCHYYKEKTAANSLALSFRKIIFRFLLIN